MKKLAIENLHIQLGAKMAPFAGYNMPIEYTGIINEHLCVRNDVGIFDVSHMGVIWVKGSGCLPYLQYITSNDVSKLFPGKVQYSCFPNGKGGIVDDLLVYKFSDTKYMLVINASNIEKDWEWLNKNLKNFKVELENASDRMGIFAVQGPKSFKIMQKLVNNEINQMKHYEFLTTKIAGKTEVILATTGYTGEPGFEIYFNNNDAEFIWNEIFKAGTPENLKPIGLAARDTLRLEMGYSLYGNDIDETTSPIEAGLSWITKLNENKEFIDKEFLIKQKETGVNRKMVGFELIDKGIPRHDYIIISEKSEEIGKVTSGTMSPSLKKGIGMGYVKAEYAIPGKEIFIQIRNKPLKAKVVSYPFYKK